MTQSDGKLIWHATDLQEIQQYLQANEDGLSSAEAAERLKKYGENKLPEQPPVPLWLIIVRQFYNPLIYILVLAAIVSAMIGDLKDAGFIAVVLAINAIIGAYQEWKAEQSSHALRKLLQIKADVRRNGEVEQISAELVVPGDVVLLESGNRIPADLRLLSANGLEVDESLLTGESLAVTKDFHWTGAEDIPASDRQNMCFAGAVVTRGRGVGLVVATGTETDIGKLALDVNSGTGGKSPLLERMEKFTNYLAIGTLVIAVGIGVLGVGLGRYEASEMFMFVVALSVAAIPEGLPVAMTIALAIATSRMAKRGVIVRRLTAVEGLGSCTLIATDKTGTLTVNELTVREIQLPDSTTFSVTGEGFEPNGEVRKAGQKVLARQETQLQELARAGILCNEADLRQQDDKWTWRGDAVDLALLSLGHKLECPTDLLAQYPQVHEIPFESENQYAATFHEHAGQGFLFVKGAPEKILSMCNHTTDKPHFEKLAVNMAAQGYRVLALAEGTFTPGELGETPEAPQNLKFLGYVGMIDPLRADVREAIQECHAAGVDVTMITGDHQVTALAIARELDLAQEESQVLTGPELSKKSEAEMVELVNRVRVFARVAPRQKLQLVQAAQKAGHFVAVTGDGVNDAPALQAANIGVSMGKQGTDVAREASEMVISDDNFSTIVVGIEEGRIAFDNIRKVIYLLLSTGAAELLMVLLAVCAALNLPLLPVQLLWLNLVTNGIQGVAIAFEPGEKDILKRKPRRPSEPIFNQLMIERMIVGVLVMGGVSFGAFYWLTSQGAPLAEAQNFVLLLMVLFENFHIGNCRSETKSAFSISPLKSPMLMLGALAAFGVHVIAMHLPFMQNVLGTAPVSAQTWIVAILLAVMVVPIMEFHKWTWYLRYGHERD